MALALIPAVLEAQVANSSSDRERRTVFGLHASQPQAVAVGVGVIVPMSRTRESFTGPALFAEAGLGGGRLSAALVSYSAIGAFGAQLRASVLRTWGEPSRVEPAQTFIGPEARVTIAYLTVGIGHYWRTAGRAPEESRFTGLSAGIGF